MLKFAVLLLVIVVIWRWIFGAWPWSALAAPRGRERARPDALAQARDLLGVTPKADAAAIRAAHRKRIARIHPDRGGSSDAVHEADAARDLLLRATPPEPENRS